MTLKKLTTGLITLCLLSASWVFPVMAETGLPEVTIVSAGVKSSDLAWKTDLPQVENLSNAFYQEFLNSTLQKDAQNGIDQVTEAARQVKAESGSLTAPYEFTATTEYVLNPEQKLLSLIVTYYEYTGGAHGNTYVKTYNVDYLNNQTLSLADLFQADADYVLALNEAIAAQIAASPQDHYFKAENAFKTIGPAQSFYIENHELVIILLAGEAAPMYLGIQEFSIPFTDLENILQLPEPLVQSPAPSELEISLDRLALNGHVLSLTAPMYYDANGTLYFPVRQALEALGYTVGWNLSSQALTLIMDGTVVAELAAGNTLYTLGETSVTLAAPLLVNSVTYAPVDLFAQGLGYGCTVDEEGIITITK